MKSHDLMHVALPVVAGNQDEVTVALRILDPELDFDGLDQGLLAHGTHDPRGAQNRDAAFDTQAGIEGVLGNTFALWYENLYREATVVTNSLGYFSDGPLDLGSGTRVDGGGTRWLVETA